VKNLRVATYNVHRCRGIDGRVIRVASRERESSWDRAALKRTTSSGGRVVS